MGWFTGKKTLNRNLIKAIDQTDIAAVKSLLDEGADPNAFSRAGRDWPLGHAIAVNSPKIIELLVAAGADLDRRDVNHTFFELALGFEKWGVLEKLFELSGKKPADCFSADHLFGAIKDEKYRTVKSLLDMGLNTDVRNNQGYTARELAVKIGNPAIIELFGPAAPLALPAPDTTNRWEVLDHYRITHITLDGKISQKTTDTFNFAARERTTIILDLEHKVQSAVIRSFDEMKDKTPLEQACDTLEQRSGIKVDRDIIHQPQRKKIPLTGPET